MDRLLFSKTGSARYISHLDTMRTFQRAFLRAGLDIRHTEGFNRHAFVSIPLPLSVGFSSDCELLEFELLSELPPEAVPQRLNAALPDGIAVKDCYHAARPIRELRFIDYRIVLEYPNALADDAEKTMTACLQRAELWVDKKSKKAKSGTVRVDVIPHVKDFSFTQNDGTFDMQVTLAAQNPGLNPQVLLSALTGEGGAPVPDFAQFHRREILDETCTVYR